MVETKGEQEAYGSCRDFRQSGARDESTPFLTISIATQSDPTDWITYQHVALKIGTKDEVIRPDPHVVTLV